jgi:hypothetical protein
LTADHIIPGCGQTLHARSGFDKRKLRLLEAVESVTVEGCSRTLTEGAGPKESQRAISVVQNSLNPQSGHRVRQYRLLGSKGLYGKHGPAKPGKSPVRVSSAAPEFIVRSPFAGTSVDFTTFYVLRSLTGKGAKRELIISKAHSYGGGRAGAGNRQHSCFSRIDGPERASAGPIRRRTVDLNIR